MDGGAGHLATLVGSGRSIVPFVLGTLPPNDWATIEEAWRAKPWAMKSFSYRPLYFIWRNPNDLKSGLHENDFTAHG
jgi:hypothetical protein